MVSCSQYAQEVHSHGESMRSFFFSWAEGLRSATPKFLLQRGDEPLRQDTHIDR
jgi:hypothetical protein